MSLLWAAAAACAVFYLSQVTAPPSFLRTLSKTLSVGLLAVIAAMAGHGALALALSFCAIGDACLSRDGERAFALGVVSFAMGHLTYIWVFLAQPGTDVSGLLRAPQVFAALAVLCVGAVLAQRIVPAAGSLRWAVAGYIPIILAMSLAALSMAPSPQTALVIAGAALFLVSDSLLAVEVFLVRAGSRLARGLARVVWPSYWGAQATFLIAFTGPPGV